MTTYVNATYRGHDLLTTREDAILCARQNPGLAYYYTTAAAQPVFRVQVWNGELTEKQMVY